jgi:L-lactate dehydrogenase complex protein LldE
MVESTTCCGFGGTFSVTEPELSCAMGRDRVASHRAVGATIITSTDVSCLMHMDGLLRRSKDPMRVLHVAEILECGLAA